MLAAGGAQLGGRTRALYLGRAGGGAGRARCAQRCNDDGNFSGRGARPVGALSKSDLVVSSASCFCTWRSDASFEGSSSFRNDKIDLRPAFPLTGGQAPVNYVSIV